MSNRQCDQCKKFFKSLRPAHRFCGALCKAAWDLEKAKERVPANCSRCGGEYLITRGAKKQKSNRGFCPACLKIRRAEVAKGNPSMMENQGRHNKLYTKKAPKITIKAPCATCIHGVVNQASDIGWMCRANAMMCRPLAGKHLYTARPA